MTAQNCTKPEQVRKPAQLELPENFSDQCVKAWNATGLSRRMQLCRLAGLTHLEAWRYANLPTFEWIPDVPRDRLEACFSGLAGWVWKNFSREGRS